MFKNIALATIVTASLIAPIAASAGEVGHRENRQENRIYQGVQNGQLTRGEYDRLQSREGRINNQRLNDLRKDGGHLTARQYAQLNREENHLSNAIYRDKHNGKKPGGH